MLARVAKFFSLDSGALFAIAAVLSVVPLWIPEFPPLVDLAQHAAQVASLHEIWSGNPLYTSTFEVNWFTPYLGGYLLLYLVSTALPIVTATKLVVSAAAIALPVVSGLLLREIGADERLKWLAIPGGYSFALYWGFMVYLAAVPIALLLFYFTVRFDKRPTFRNGLGIAGFSIALFYCHVIALCFCALISLTYLAAKNFRNPASLLRRAVPYTAPLPLIAIWMLGVLDTEASVQNAPVVFDGLRAKLVVLFNQLSGLDGVAFGVSLLIVGVVLLLPFAAGYRVSRRPERWLPLAVGFLVYLIFPSYMQNTAFLYHRLAVFLIPLWLIVWDPPARSPRMFFGVGILAALGLWIGVNGNRFLNFAREAESFESVMRYAEPGRKMAGMLFCNSSEFFVNPVYLHFAAWYQAVSGGVADMSFATTHPSLVRYRDMQAPRVVEQLAWRPEAFQWERDGGPTYDYFIVCAGGNASELVFKDHVHSVELIAHVAPWWLYRNLEKLPGSGP